MNQKEYFSIIKGERLNETAPLFLKLSCKQKRLFSFTTHFSCCMSDIQRKTISVFTIFLLHLFIYTTAVLWYNKVST